MVSSIEYEWVKSKVAETHHFNADLYSASHLNEDSDPTFHCGSGSGSIFHYNTGAEQKDADQCGSGSTTLFKKNHHFAHVGICSFPPKLLLANGEKLRFLPFIKDKYA